MLCFAGREEAQQLYQSQASLPPLVLDFHYTIIDLELKEAHPNVEFIRKVYEKAAMQFGQKNKGNEFLIEVKGNHIFFFYTTCKNVIFQMMGWG